MLLVAGINATLIRHICEAHHADQPLWSCMAVGVTRALGLAVAPLLVLYPIELRARRAWLLHSRQAREA